MVSAIFSRRPDGTSIKVGVWISGTAYFNLGPKHYFHNKSAWGIDEDAFAQIASMDTKEIVLDIHSNGTKRRLSASLDCFNANSFVHQWPGFSPRRFMREDLWTTEGKEQMEMGLKNV